MKRNRVFRKNVVGTVIAFSVVLLAAVCYSCDPPGGGQGSISNPILIDATFAGTQYAGSVDTGKKYYYTQGDDPSHIVTINLVNLSDDGDIISFGTDSTFTTEAAKPFYGRTKEETITGSGTDHVYFAVDGGYTTAGATYTLVVTSRPAAAESPADKGTIGGPVLMPTGEYYFSSVGTGTSYYRAPVTIGENFGVNLFGASTLNVYSDSSFTTPVGGLPFTAATGEVYISVGNGGTGTWINLEVAGNEGSTGDPVPLFLEKTNYAQTGGLASYYVFAATAGTSYTVSVTNMSNDVNLFVFDSNNFTSQAAVSANAGTTPESGTVTPTGAWISVAIEDGLGNGATFRLKVVEN